MNFQGTSILIINTGYYEWFSTDYNIVLNEAKVPFINSSCSIDCGSHYRVEIISLSFVCPTVGNNGYNLIGVKLLNDETNVLDELSCAHK